MFDSRSEAEAARQRLSQSNIDADRVRIIDQSSSGSGSTSSGGGSPGEEGFFASLKDLFMPDDDRHAYGEGIRRGGFMLAAEVDEHQADEACRILEQSSSVDFDQRQDDWRQQGWAGYQADAQSGAFGRLSGHDQHQSSAMTGQTGRTGETVAEEHIPIVEEELRVGKREVERGGARVRSYVREIPVHEQVSLREEHVSVERRPVSGDAMRDGNLGQGDVFRDREIELTERSEEAVVAKEARVTEEVVVRKTAEEHVENIDDTVRRTEVEVDEDRGAFGFDRDRDNNGVRDDLERSSTTRDRDGLI
jgi:uncharacterized protein (TIGR02271 family)